MDRSSRLVGVGALLGASLLLFACGGGGNGGGSSSSGSGGGGSGGSGGGAGQATYAVGGTVGGLASGGSVALLNNGGDPVTITGNGSFQFKTQLAAGAAYYATVGTQPNNGQLCAVNGWGTMPSANVTNVTVTCLTAGGPIVGSWYFDANAGGAQMQPVVMTFFANNTYLLAWDETDTNAGIEFGTYTYNSSTGQFSTSCASINSNPPGGLSYDGGPNSGCVGTTGVIGVSGSSLSFAFNNAGTHTMTGPIVNSTNPIVGSWFHDFGTATAPLPVVFTFFSNGTYVMADDSNTTAADPSGQPGIEVGSYTFNISTGALSTTCPRVNTDGAWGLSNQVGPGCTGANLTLTFSNNNNTVTTSTGMVLTRQ